MIHQRMEPETLCILSRLFTYPETLPSAEDLNRIAPAKALPTELALNRLNLTGLQNQYVRLFINGLPEIPCAPYGSYYLEGILMGATTVRLNRLYLEYGFKTDELADHIAVEIEFLAFLSYLVDQTDKMEVENDYAYVLAHLNKWTPEFFSRIEEHDESGFYRQAVQWARQIIH